MKRICVLGLAFAGAMVALTGCESTQPAKSTDFEPVKKPAAAAAKPAAPAAPAPTEFEPVKKAK